MVRSLAPYGFETSYFENRKVDKLFDFYSLGNNYRNTDFNAFVGLLDFKRVDKYKKLRKELYAFFKSKLDLEKFYLPEEVTEAEDVPFCLPIISKERKKEKALQVCKELNIEHRPIILGYLGYQTCYKKYFNSSDWNYRNSIDLHNNGFYVGLFHKLSKRKIGKLVSELNNI